MSALDFLAAFVFLWLCHTGYCVAVMVLRKLGFTRRRSIYDRVADRFVIKVLGQPPPHDFVELRFWRGRRY